MGIFNTDRQDRIYFYLKLYEDIQNGEKLINTFDIFEMLSKKNQKKVSFMYFEKYKEGIETLFKLMEYLEIMYPWGKRIGKKIYTFFYMECNIKTLEDFAETFLNDDIKIKGVSEKYMKIIKRYVEEL